MANLTGNLLLDCARHLAGADRCPKTLVCSGMLESEADGVGQAFAEVGLAEARRLTEYEWAALLLRRSED